MSQPTNKTAKQQRKPAKTFRVGLLSASVWENETDNGTFHSVTLERAYKDGEEWKYTNTFRLEDLCNVGFLCGLAGQFILGQQNEGENGK
jgi:hypothetical protein